MTDNAEHTLPSATGGSPRKWLSPLLTAVCLSFTVCVYAPLETYFAASDELWFGANDVILMSLAAFAVLALALFGLGMLLRGRARAALCGLFVGLSLALYAQGSFLNADYGRLDGMAIDWASFGSYPVWNALIWAALLIAPAVLCAVFIRGAAGATRFVCVILCLAQLAGVIALGASAPVKQEEKVPTLTDKYLFDISKDKNVVMFLVDTFDTTSFGDMLDELPDIAERLDGFTWFTNSVGQYNMTSYAMPLIMSGECYTIQEYQGSFSEKAWENEKFFHSLKDEGYSLGIYTEPRYAYASQEGILDNALSQSMKPSSYPTLWGKLMELAAFRYLPHSLKPLFASAGAGFDTLVQGDVQTIYDYENESFLRKLRSEGVNATLSEPCLRMYHMSGMHVPYTLGADEKNGDEVLRNKQAATLMNAICDYIDMMKAQGVFDSSMIIITADHGLKYSDLRPVLLVKRPGDKGALAKNAALVSQLDWHSTIAAAMNAKFSPNYGEDAFSISEDDMREVPHYSTEPNSGDLYEYTVSLDECGTTYYKPAHFAYRYGDSYDVERSSYSLGTYIELRTEEDYRPWLDEMSLYDIKSTNAGVYLGKPDITFDMLIEDEDYYDLAVTLGIGDIVGDSRSVQVLVDGEVIAEKTLKKGDTELRFTVPYDYCYDYALAFTLRFPDAISEYERGGWQGGDTRVLAVMPTGITIESSEEE